MTIALLVSLLSGLSFAQETDAKFAVNPVKLFKEYLSKHFESYKTDRRERLTELGGGWVKAYYEPDVNYKIDVQKTNSLITPFTGFCEFTLTRHRTKFYATKNEAKNDYSFIESDKWVHRHHYGFQDGKWEITSRTHQGPKLANRIKPLTNRSVLDKWYDCNEVIALDKQRSLTNIHGCWEMDN